MEAEIATLRLPLFQKVLSADSLTLLQERPLNIGKRLSLPWHAPGGLQSMSAGTDANKCCQRLFQWGPDMGLIDSRAFCHWNHTDFSINSRSYYRICSGVVSIPNKAKHDTRQVSSALLAQIFTSTKLNVLPELIQEDRKKKTKKGDLKHWILFTWLWSLGRLPNLRQFPKRKLW